MNKRGNIWPGGLLGGGTGAVVIALAYLGERLAGLPFVPFAWFDWLARVLPGSLVTLGVEALVRVITHLQLGPTSATAKRIEHGLAIALFLLVGVAFGVALSALPRLGREKLRAWGALGGAVLGMASIAIQASLGSTTAGLILFTPWLVVIFVGWGMLLGRLVELTLEVGTPPEEGISRRRFLYLVGLGSLGVVASALGLRLTGRTETSGTGAAPLDVANPIEGISVPEAIDTPPKEVLEARFTPVNGTRPEITSNQDFYRIDINSLPPRVDGASWRLQVGGLVERPLSLSLDELIARPAVSQFITLECISNGVGGDLISTALWTGVRLKDILAEAGLKTAAREVYVESVDGFYESVNWEDIQDERTLLVYAMNGELLPVEHGFPLRIYIPNRYGMKQPKWITRLEAIDYDGPGYWVDRGWSPTAIPQTTSVIDTVIVDQANEASVGMLPGLSGGIAYAGGRGISRVEVQVDEGRWEAAELRSPPISPLTWVQWRHTFRFPPGRHLVQVRAYDGTGALQFTHRNQAHPDGATGIHSRSVDLPG